MKKLVLTSAAAAIGGLAFAQRINIDVGANVVAPLPAPTLGAAAAQTGTWNSVAATVTTSAPLVDVTGAATSVTVTRTGGAFDYDGLTLDPVNAGCTGDDYNLMDDISDPGSSATWTINGLAAGNYKLYTYAWAPDYSPARSVVAVAGSSDPAQVIGGVWPSGYALGITHALHHATVSAGGSIAMTMTVNNTFASLNGFQIVPDVAGTPFCVPNVGGVMACVCNNPGSAGNGCANTGATGANLAVAGNPRLAADATDPGSLTLTGNNMFQGSSCIFLQGDIQLAGGTTFGAGIRCAGGQLLRLYVKGISGGVATGPVGADRSISNRSSDLGAPIASGATRYYQIYYRDPNLTNPGGACPPNATFNVSSGQIVVWN